MALSITWYGHSTFRIVTPKGRAILTDPFFSSPGCPPDMARPEAALPLDLILVSHGHPDHILDLLPVARATPETPIVCIYELGLYLGTKGLKQVRDMGIGGTQQIDGLRITMVPAVHSGATLEEHRLIYLGGAAGYILREEGMPTIYFAGDTTLFGDMKIIRDLYQPRIAFLPIGDHYTMGPDLAAMAAEWLEVEQVVPMHWGTFPLLTGTPAKLAAHLKHTGIQVLELAPGESTA
jgi:L-ascorbate metabolism protein UlaG (beta-lactamase superfamily)